MHPLRPAKNNVRKWVFSGTRRPAFKRVHVPKDQSQWKLDDSDLDETWSAGSAGPKTSVECHFWDIRTRTVGLGGSEGPKYDFFLERFFGKNFFLPIAGK